MNESGQCQLELPWCSAKPKTLAQCVQDFTEHLRALPRNFGPVVVPALPARRRGVVVSAP